MRRDHARIQPALVDDVVVGGGVKITLREVKDGVLRAHLPYFSGREGGRCGLNGLRLHARGPERLWNAKKSLMEFRPASIDDDALEEAEASA